MVEARHLKPADYLVQAWKNGAGETFEIAVDRAEPYRWRVSTARVEKSGEFSSFPNYQRILVCLDGSFVVSHEGKPERRLLPFEAYSFRGEWKTRATVTMPFQDFNVFSRHDQIKAGVYPVHFKLEEEMQFPLSGLEHFVFCVDGQVDMLEPNSHDRFSLSARETIRISRLDTREYLNLRAICRSYGARCLWVVLSEAKPKRTKKSARK